MLSCKWVFSSIHQLCANFSNSSFSTPFENILSQKAFQRKLCPADYHSRPPPFFLLNQFILKGTFLLEKRFLFERISDSTLNRNVKKTFKPRLTHVHYFIYRASREKLYQKCFPTFQYRKFSIGIKFYFVDKSNVLGFFAELMEVWFMNNLVYLTIPCGQKKMKIAL